ncbi:cytochrome P450 3A5-like [Tachypleus tridentatus]|uniref:cytochrome P450 3A5-like n=1 Tax=Tachypleus tridentatus TaxID=6853 RepID=UPI003FD58FB2
MCIFFSLLKGAIKCHEEWIKKYGKICGFYFGRLPIVIVADLDLLRQIQIKDLQKITGRPRTLLDRNDFEVNATSWHNCNELNIMLDISLKEKKRLQLLRNK